MIKTFLFIQIISELALDLIKAHTGLLWHNTQIFMRNTLETEFCWVTPNSLFLLSDAAFYYNNCRW